jgi:DNA-binding NarL/FixJ family response regulator
MEGVIEALANPSRPVRRLLKMAEAWPTGLPDAPQPVAYQTARQLRPAEVDELVKAYEKGETTQELGKRFGVYRATVGRHLRARGVDTTPPALTPEKVQEAARLYREGWTLARIANRYGVGANTVRTHLMASGVKMRPRGRSAVK